MVYVKDGKMLWETHQDSLQNRQDFFKENYSGALTDCIISMKSLERNNIDLADHEKFIETLAHFFNQVDNAKNIEEATEIHDKAKSFIEEYSMQNHKYVPTTNSEPRILAESKKLTPKQLAEIGFDINDFQTMHQSQEQFEKFAKDKTVDYETRMKPKRKVWDIITRYGTKMASNLNQMEQDKKSVKVNEKSQNQQSEKPAEKVEPVKSQDMSPNKKPLESTKPLQNAGKPLSMNDIRNQENPIFIMSDAKGKTQFIESVTHDDLVKSTSQSKPIESTKTVEKSKITEEENTMRQNMKTDILIAFAQTSDLIDRLRQVKEVRSTDGKSIADLELFLKRSMTMYKACEDTNIPFDTLLKKKMLNEEISGLTPNAQDFSIKSGRLHDVMEEINSQMTNDKDRDGCIEKFSKLFTKISGNEKSGKNHANNMIETATKYIDPATWDRKDYGNMTDKEYESALESEAKPMLEKFEGYYTKYAKTKMDDFQKKLITQDQGAQK